MTTLTDKLDRALTARTALIERLHAEATNAYRLFHGSVEGVPGLTVDRYGDLLLVQSFHAPLSAAEFGELESFYGARVPGLVAIYNDRSNPHSRISNRLEGQTQIAAREARVAEELGVKYRIRARHSGQDPWLFLDMRAGRRVVLAESAGKSVLNLFSYTCGIGICAAKAGATRSLNIDFASSSLEVGQENALLNGLQGEVDFLQSDVFPAVRQLSGIGQPTRVRGQQMPPFPKLERESFDLVFLDPPRYAKSPFGVVDAVNDYQALLKPALLATAIDGVLIACNNVARVAREEWRGQVERCAAKAGRPIREWSWIVPEEDFPSFDGQPPLKMARLQL